jgi:hypothetical protein
MRDPEADALVALAFGQVCLSMPHKRDASGCNLCLVIKKADWRNTGV